jgi:voltage-gated potassium channel
MSARHPMPNPVRIAGVALVALLFVGTGGYRFIEGMPWLDAVYMTVITVTTVGFGEIHPLSQVGRGFTIALILAGVVIGTYSITTLAGSLFSGEWQQRWADRRRMEQIRQLRGHVILCGYGRVGRHVAAELQSEGIPFIVLEVLGPSAHKGQEAGLLVLHADASHEANLRMAGIEHAQGLIAAANTDAENVFIVLTAHALQPDLTIVARADSEESEAKLRRAGASRVILPYHLTGRRMVSMLTRPAVSEFLDEVTHTSGLELLVEQIPVAPGSLLDGITLDEARRVGRLDLTILGMRHPDGRFDTRITGELRLLPGCLVIAVGTREQLQKAISG